MSAGALGAALLGPVAAHAYPYSFSHKRIANNASGQRRWVSSTGLSYTERVLANVVGSPQAGQKAPAGKLFHGGWRGALKSVEEAWQIVTADPKSPRVSTQDQGDGVKVYVVDMQKEIGHVGDTGPGKLLPASHVRLVVAQGKYLLAGGPTRGAHVTGAAWNTPVLPAATHPEKTLEDAEIVRTLVSAGAWSSVAAKATEHVRFGLPSQATYKSRTDRLRVRNGYVLSMNANTKILNWASWMTTQGDFDANANRANDWRTDPTLGRGFPLVGDDDYRGSGMEFHRGHIVRSGERSAKLRENSKTYVYSNALPQAKHSNIGPWNGLEEWVRVQTEQGYRVYNQAGPVFSGAVKMLGSGVAVPSALFKIVTLLAPGETTVTKNTRVVAVMIPNTNEIPMTAHWADYRVSVADVEAATGLRFFAHLPKELATTLRARVDEAHIEYVMPPHVQEELDRAAQRKSKPAATTVAANAEK